jgi:large subunit ribosomal protein L29|tara:strand:- start:1379 stop:1630 length:252 start_codon:yes stop_codon:yes gene_type:complete
MKAKEIRNSDKSSINEKVLEMKKELVKVSAQIASGSTLKNPGQVKKIRKTLARIITIQAEKKLQSKKDDTSKVVKRKVVDKKA